MNEKVIALSVMLAAALLFTVSACVPAMPRRAVVNMPVLTWPGDQR